MAEKNLLVELLVEELPPRSLRQLGEAFGATLVQVLAEQGLVAAGAAVAHYATPRRLAVHIANVAARAPDRRAEIKLMPVKVAFDAAGLPSPALLKKLASVGASEATIPALVRRPDSRGEILFLVRDEPGVTLAAGLQLALDTALQALPIPKVMTYQLADGWSNVRFVRPARRLLALHGAEVVPVSALGLCAGNTTAGHRFAANARDLELRSADHYADRLERDGAVLPSFAGRRAAIRAQVDQLAAAQDLVPVLDDALLDEVTALVEWPNVLVGRFEAELLEVPQECLVLTMQQHQKYFPLLDRTGRLTNRFLLVANIRPDDPSAVVSGNERVVRARLADARFFYDQDRRQPLAARTPGLAKVVYHHKLGSLADRVDRLAALATALGERLGGAGLARQAERAARLAKLDLLTDMVGEFPSLQGIMGGYYARGDGEPEDIATAIADHYRPRFHGDELPRSDAGTVVALADKLEAMVGMFGIGQTPTGDKDPYGLRRQALGVIRLLVERQLPLRLDELIRTAVPLFGDAIQDPTAALLDFCFDRLAAALRDEGYAAREIDAVLSLRPQRLAEVRRRLDAVQAFLGLPEAGSLAAANKRIGNILRKSEQEQHSPVDQRLFTDDHEHALHAALIRVAAAAGPRFDAGDYAAALAICAELRQPVDAFFDHVMVNAPDEALRRNRHALLRELHALMNRTADLARLAS